MYFPVSPDIDLGLPTQHAMATTIAGSMTTLRQLNPAYPCGATSLESGACNPLKSISARMLISELGARLDITTNQPATQVYTSYSLNTPRKLIHGGPSLNYTNFSAVAIEQEGYIGAINTPEWGVDQICECLFTSDRVYYCILISVRLLCPRRAQ